MQNGHTARNKDIYTRKYQTLNGGIAHLKVLIEEGNEKSPTGKLMRNLMENHALEMGIGGDIFQAPFQPLKECITDTWFKSTLEFISENNITIDSPMAQLQLWRTGDTFLTADAIEAGMSGKT